MTYFTELTELMTAILVGVLFSIFMSAFFILVVILQRKTRNGISYFSKNKQNYNKEIKLLKPVSPHVMQESSEMSIIDDFYDNLNNFNLASVQDDPRWAEQASTLISHCMAVLMHCRSLTEKLTGLAINTLDEWDPQMAQLVDIAKLITLRVDQFISCMRPPLNPSILEARAASLTLAVTHLAIMTQYECRSDNLPAEWISKLLNNIQKHIDLLNCETENFFHSKQSIQILNTPISI